jgi:hypothetical protein
MPSGKKRKRHKMATHKRKKRLRKNSLFIFLYGRAICVKKEIYIEQRTCY